MTAKQAVEDGANPDTDGHHIGRDLVVLSHQEPDALNIAEPHRENHHRQAHPKKGAERKFHSRNGRRGQLNDQRLHFSLAEEINRYTTYNDRQPHRRAFGRIGQSPDQIGTQSDSGDQHIVHTGFNHAGDIGQDTAGKHPHDDR